MNQFTKTSISVFVNFCIATNQLFSQVPPPPPGAVNWVSYSTGPNGEPGWWAGRGATNASPIVDFAPVKQGQLKHFTRKAVDEINARYASLGGAGSTLNNQITTWLNAHTTNSQTSKALDQENITVGQLKWVANLIHTRLVAIGAAPSKPEWLVQNFESDKELANIGQLKTVFNFTTIIPTNLDKDGDGMPDAWEIANGSDPNVKNANQSQVAGDATWLSRYTDSLLPNIPGALATIPALSIDGEAPHQAVGAIKGVLSVGGDGSASYSVPIDIPKGTSGMEPKLSLGYSSNVGNGVMGVGWNLGGLQRITRGPATVAKDGFFDPVDFDVNDRFFLDGERLVCVSGTYGAGGSEYRTEIDSYGRIKFNGSSWQVETKAGLIMTLGGDVNGNSRVVAPGYGTLSWGVNRVSDTLGNYYAVVYDRGVANENIDIINFRVKSIHYTGNDQHSLTPYCSVEFVYVDRPDKTRSFSTHASYRSSVLLTNVHVKTGGYINHTYTLGYEKSYQTGRSFLKTLGKSVNGGNPVPPTTFQYDGIQGTTDGSSPIWGPSLNVGMPQLVSGEWKDRGFTFADFNGDALTDYSTWRATTFNRNATTNVLWPTTEGEVRLNSGYGYGGPDGTAGGFSDNQSSVYCPPTWLPLAINANETSSNVTDFNKHRLTAQQVDVDGDGKLDLLGSVDIRSGNGWITNRYEFFTHDSSSPNRWKKMHGWDLPFSLKNQGDTGGDNDGGKLRDRHFQWIDLNADGYQDLVIHTSAIGQLIGPNGAIMLDNNQGTAFLNNKGKDGIYWVRANDYALPRPLLDNEGADVGHRLVDLNGDGVPEFLKARYEDGSGLEPEIHYLKGGNWKNAKFSNNASYLNYILPVGLVRSSGTTTSAMLLDVNGDGLVDILNSQKRANDTVQNNTHLNRGSRTTNVAADKDAWQLDWIPGSWADQENSYRFPYRLYHEHTRYGSPDVVTSVAHGFEFADLNGDGLVDALFSDCADGDENHQFTSAFGENDRNCAILNTGNGWKKRSEWGNVGAMRYYSSAADRLDGKRNLRLQDIDGDGFPDLITGLRSNVAGVQSQVRFNKCRPEVLISVTDGLGTNGIGNTLKVVYRRLNDPSAAQPFGTPVYDRNPAADSPLKEGHSTVIDARLVVSRYCEPNGRGGERWRGQRYGDLRYDRKNEASLGFGWIEAKDEENFQVNRVKYHREYPFAGSPVLTQTTVHLAPHHITGNAGANIPGLGQVVPGITAGEKCLTSESATYAELPSTPGVGGGGGAVRRPVQTNSNNTSFDLQGNIVAKTDTNQAFDGFGFVTSSTVTSQDGSSVSTNSSYNHNTNLWHLGRLSSSTVTKSHTPKNPITKSSAFTYDPGNGLLKSETVQPGHALATTKTYTHDKYGNVVGTKVSAPNSISAHNLTERSSSSGYDSTGRFMTSETNQLGDTVTYAYNETLAQLTSTTDIVLRKTDLIYDAYGTLRYTNLPDGSRFGESTGFANNGSLPSSVAQHCWNPIVFFHAKQVSGSPVGKAYFDALGREIVNETTILRNADNTGAARYSKIYTVSQYDDLGRKVVTSQPFSADESARFTRIHMDPINRVLRVDHPDGTTDATETLQTQVLNGQNHSYSRVRNRASGVLERWEDTQGRLVQSRDPSGQITTFYHDVEGRLLNVKINGAQLLTNTFDLLGNKISVTEVNSGTSTSVYNAYGEVVSSTNAKGQITSFTYDSSGRPVTVVKPEATFTTEYYETGMEKRKPHRTSNNRAGIDFYQEIIRYDSLARPITTIKTQFGETFATATVYDALGRSHAESDAGGLIVVHEYDPAYSFATKLKMGPGKIGAGKILWSAGIYDSSGRALTQRLANGVGVAAIYDARNGNVLSLAGSQNSGDPSYNGIPIQSKAYEWDALGNLTARYDAANQRRELFGYDGLNRVISATTFATGGATTSVPPPASFSYDTNGNLRTKSGATLNYADATRVHAVTTATVKGAARNYSYDAAGYVQSDSKRNYTWSSFGQIKTLDYTSAPALQSFAGLQIFAASRVQSDFAFDAGGNRARQIKQRIAANDSRQIEETLYLGSYEREIHTTKATASAAPVETKRVHRHSIGGFATYTINETYAPNGITIANSVIKLTTILKDHLGSTDVLYTSTWGGENFGNNVTERQSFDPWAERRAADTHINFRVGDGDAFRTSATDYDRGYTGHEQLDDSGLIHMNGRLYDPELGRMLSPDPYVQIPEFSQNFNRYSYVLNNPLNLTDPSGFSFWGKTHNAFSSWLKQNWRTVVVIVVVVVLTIITAGAFIAAAGVAGSAFATAGVAATATAGATAGSLTALGGAVVGAIGGAVGGGLSAALAGGDLGDVLRGAVIGGVQGAITGGLLHGMGEAANTAGFFSAETAAHVAGHGVVGGASNAAMGGKFSDGFYSAAAGAAASHFGPFVNTKGAGGVIARTVQAGLVGGTASVIGGGKFANGAYTAALQHLLNAEQANLYNKATATFGNWMANTFGPPSDSMVLLGESAGATLDGVIPFGDPIGESGGYNYADPDLAISRGCGEVIQFASTTAVTGLYATAALPKSLIHFTTARGAIGIAQSGTINASKVGLFGPGTYLTRIGRPINLFVQAGANIPIHLATPSGTIRIIPKLVYLRPFRSIPVR